jgi:hypothetical protein
MINNNIFTSCSPHDPLVATQSSFHVVAGPRVTAPPVVTDQFRPPSTYREIGLHVRSSLAPPEAMRVDVAAGHNPIPVVGSSMILALSSVVTSSSRLIAGSGKKSTLHNHISSRSNKLPNNSSDCLATPPSCMHATAECASDHPFFVHMHMQHPPTWLADIRITYICIRVKIRTS